MEFLKKHDVEYVELFDISSVSSMGIGGKALLAVIPNDTDKLIKALDFLKDNLLKYKIVGAMTNILPPDTLYNGVLVLTQKIRCYSLAENILTADCGAKLSSVLLKVAKKNLGGMEELFGIPGSVGGMVSGNAGAYGKSISDFFIDAKIYSPSKKCVISVDRSQMDFSYRNSSIKNTDNVLLSASFSLQSIPYEKIKEKMKTVISKRKSAQPYSEKSLGSVFLRCGDIPTSLMIDRLGLKGYSIGGAEISKKHAGFIINRENATSEDVNELILFIKDKIFSFYGVMPKEEIEYLN
jgi:UDP-N-acetylmuramate dehydrogenase